MAETQPLKLHNLSKTAVKLRLYFEEEELATGSGFFYDYASTRWLVTAGHNILAKHPETGRNISRNAGIPDRLVMEVAHVAESRGEVAVVGWHDVPVKLYADDDRLQARWIQHLSGPSVDIAAINVAEVDTSWHIAVNQDLNDYIDFRVYAGYDAFVLGFPEGWSGGGRTPIWKRATVAIEPSIAEQRDGYILVDTATRPGMSGAPVFARDVGIIHPQSIEHLLSQTKGLHEQSVIGTAYKFLGIYTSRPMPDGTATLAQLGKVYLPLMIEKLFEGQIAGLSPF